MKPFDERLYTRKLQEALVPRMHRDSAERRHKVLSHQREIGQNLAGALHKLVDTDISLIRDYVPEVDTACSETWLSDGNPVTADFIRNVLVHRVFSFIAVREGDSRGNLERLARRCGIGGTHLTPAIHHLVHSMNQLKSEVANRYEIKATELSKKESQARKVTQAHPPPREVGGLGVTHSRAKPTQIPPDFPIYFPKELKARTAVILAEAVRKFQYQTQTLELCRHVISEMIPLFREAVTNGTMKASMALEEGLGGMGDLLRSLVVYNDDGPRTGWGLSNEAYRLQQEARKSDEWLRLAKATADAEQQLHNQKDAAPAESKLINVVGSNIRESFLRPLLRGKGWSVHDWANEARVDFHTANDYLKGKTKPYPATRKKLADALGIDLSKMPE